MPPSRLPRLVLACLSLGLMPALAATPSYRIEPIAEGLEHPWSLAFLPDGRALVTERAGRLRLIGHAGLRDAALAGVPAVFASGQAGLFDVLLDPDFATNRHLYLSFAQGTEAANHLRVVRARFTDAGLSEVEIILDAQPDKRGDAHFGWRMALLPDATLVIGVGDGFIRREDAQRLDNHFGKFLRIGRDGRVPPDNPFLAQAGARPEIYSLGHRNPQAVLYDPQHAILFAHEHGPRGGDELNRIEAGRNYGWPLATQGVDYTGARISPWQNYPETEPPLLHWTPSVAPAGMSLYRGDRFPAWRDSLMVATLVEKSVRRIPLQNGIPGEVQDILFAELDERLRDVRVAPDGSLWLLTDSARGRVLRVRPSDAKAVAPADADENAEADADATPP
jgi:glucose/arabinose dehydrogenase